MFTRFVFLLHVLFLFLYGILKILRIRLLFFHSSFFPLGIRRIRLFFYCMYSFCFVGMRRILKCLLFLFHFLFSFFEFSEYLKFLEFVCPVFIYFFCLEFVESSEFLAFMCVLFSCFVLLNS